jgi:hypothetical protein
MEVKLVIVLIVIAPVYSLSMDLVDVLEPLSIILVSARIVCPNVHHVATLILVILVFGIILL